MMSSLRLHIMKTASFLVLTFLVLSVPSTRGQSSEPQARKFDEFTDGIGGPEYGHGNWEDQQREVNRRLALYAKELARTGARPYAITYSPRIVPWEIYDRSIAEMRSGALWLTPHVDWRNINVVNGGFREIAATELWIVPPGAQPPCPTPTVKPADVSYCPFFRIVGAAYVPVPATPITLKAEVEVNRDKVKPGFDWTVSSGEIVSGQGTDSISVRLPPGSEGELVARATLKGFSLQCPTDSTTAISRTAFGVRHHLFRESGNINMEQETAELDYLAITLQSDLSLQAHLVFYGGRSDTAGKALARAGRAKDYLTMRRGLDADRIMIVDGGYRHELSSEYWLSLRGTAGPPTRPTVDEAFVNPVIRPKPPKPRN